MKFIQLPSGNFLNLNMIEKVKFTSEDDTKQVKHLIARIEFMSDVEHYRDNDAIFLKDYFDKHSGFFLIHEQDYAVQSLALGLAVEIIGRLSEESHQEVSEHIIEIATNRMNELLPEEVKRIRKSYEDNFGTGKGYVNELIRTNENTQTSPATV